MLDNEWKAWITSESKKVLSVLETVSTSVEIQINNKSFDFKLEGSQLSGKIEDDSYRLIFERDTQLLLVYSNQKLNALFQPIGNERSSTLKIFMDGNEENLAKILNLHQIYNQAIYTLKEADNRNN